MEINPNGYANTSGQAKENNLNTKDSDKNESFLNSIRSGSAHAETLPDNNLDSEHMLCEEYRATQLMLTQKGSEFAQTSTHSLNSYGDGVDVLVDQKWFATGKLSYKNSTFIESLDRSETQIHTANRQIPVAASVNTPSNLNALKFDSNQEKNIQLNKSNFTEGSTSSSVTREHIGSIRRKSGVNLPEYLKKKITILERNDEIEVLVRDYSIDKDMLRQTVKLIEDKLESSGGKIKRLVINGKLAEELKW